MYTAPVSILLTLESLNGDVTSDKMVSLLTAVALTDGYDDEYQQSQIVRNQLIRWSLLRWSLQGDDLVLREEAVENQREMKMKLPRSISRPLFDHMFRSYRKWKTGSRSALVRKPQNIDSHTRQAFDALLQSGLDKGVDEFIDYALPYPKIDFLNYVCDQQGYVVHGSRLSDLTELAPIRHTKDKTEFGNRQQLFCSPDAVWAMWFAILDKGVAKATSNGCIRLGVTSDDWAKYYFFELPTFLKETEEAHFIDGTIYIARAKDFSERRQIAMFDFIDMDVEEWGSVEPVQPLAKLSVTPEDFPYLQQVDYVIDIDKFTTRP